LARSVWLVAAGFVVLELAVSARYGFHRDELYFIVAGRHPALGYVDQPPLAPMLTRLSTFLFGTSPTAIRLIPALAGAAVVVTAGMTARLLGGGRSAQLLAALAMACAPVTLAAAHLANTTVYDLLAWSVTTACAIAAVEHGRSRAWIGAGVAAGVGLENKDLLVLLVVALAAGLVLTGRVRILADRWLWAAAVVALGLWAPNLIWQATHHWPEREMSAALHQSHSAASDYTTVVPAQFVYLGVAAAPLAVIGIAHLLRNRAHRYLSITLGIVVAFVVFYIPGRPYYTDGLLGVVFAAGAVRLERPRPGVSLRRWMLAPPIGLLATVVLILPVLPQAALAHVKGIHKRNYDLTETIGWPQLTDAVIHVYDQLPPGQQLHASIYTANYGEASGLIIYGDHRLPQVLSGHNTFFLWGPGRAPDATVIAVGAADQLRPYFAACRQVAAFQSPHRVDNDENGVPISVCTGLPGPWIQFWTALKHYD
jgi:4-amino-4-deoxy-L-arabinose transferase-like glycosyltransferase